MKINQMNTTQLRSALARAARAGDTASKYVQQLRQRLALLRKGVKKA